MVEIVIAVAAKVAECLVAPIARPFSYIWNYKTNFDNLKTEVRKLEGQRDTVQHSVDEARRNSEQIEQHVSDWLDRVKKMTDEASEVIGENERADMKCFKGLCPNPKKRYQHSRKAVKKTEAVARLYDEGSFPKVSFRTIPEETWIPSYKGYMAFESRMSTLKNILDELSNPDVNMVGIYGTGGIGKTTLAREIAGHAEDKKLFNVVAFAEVGVKPDINEIQQEIAGKLGLTFSEESVSGRARHLQQRLKQEEKVLLVLDNIWERLNLEDVGIPFGDDHKGCKLLLTARNSDVLSNKMDSQSNFPVGFLDKGDAWSLFENKAGDCDRLQALAKNVAEACGGLPIAINSVAVSLKAKEEFEWKDALIKLTTPSASNFEGVAAETYSSIEISYSQLKEKELSSTFLLCCIMENTHIDNLLAYGKGLGIFEKVEAMKDARNRVNTLVRKLKDSSLLLDINDNRFSLHDVVRDVGTSIASRDWNMFRNCTIRELIDKDALKNCFAITLHNISELPKEFECPELQFFYMSTTAVDNCLPDNFFVGMPKLKVLHLDGFDLNPMPNSIGLLVNLRTLYIDDCELRDIDLIGEFKQLEILRIDVSFDYDSKFKMIPKKMCNLTGLRLLDLDDCDHLQNIPPNVLSTFTRLEELYLPVGGYLGCEIEWEVEGVNILDKLKHLTLLTALQISIRDANVLPKGQLLSNKLEWYRIIIGSEIRGELYWRYKNSRRVVILVNLESSSCSDDVQKFLSVLDTEGFPELEHLWVENSPCFRTVVDCLESESCHNHFRFLELLNLQSVFNLERIHNHQLRAESFQRLTTLEVVECNKLKNIFSFSTYRALPRLQRVYVSSCDNMEEIFAINRREEGINNDEGTDQIELKELRTLRLNSLPKLTGFCSINGNKDILDTPTPLFNQKSVFNLERVHNHQLRAESFQRLTTLEVVECNKLKNIFSFSTYRALPLLQQVYVSSCDNMEEIFAINRREEGINNDEGTDQIEFKQVRSLRLEYLPKLTSFCSINGNKDILDTPTPLFNQKVSFPSLEEIEISEMLALEMIWPNQLCKDPQKMFSFQKLSSVLVHHCMSLKYLFPISIIKSLSELEKLHVHDCEVLEEIVGDDHEEAKVADTFVFPRVTYLKLEYLPRLKVKTLYHGVHTSKTLVVRRFDKFELFASELFDFQENKDWFCNIKSLEVTECNKLLTIFQSNMLERITRLESLTVGDCDLVEVIFDLQGVDFEKPHSEIETLLRKLDIKGLPKLKHIWSKDPQKMFSYQKLNSVKVHHCMNLKYLFPVSVAESLSELEKLDVHHCEVLEEIVGDDSREANVAATLVFPRITSLELKYLPQLKTFYTSQWQNLKSLTMKECNKVELFASELFNIQENNEGQHDNSLQPLFIVEKDSFPNLENLILGGKAIKMMTLLGQFSEEPFCNLKFLEVQGEESVVFPLCILNRIRHLYELCLKSCSYIEIFSYQKDETHDLIDSKLDTVLQKLESLEVYKCCNLIQLWPSSASFQNLTSLGVWDCNGLKNLMTSSTAKSLVQLREMAIVRCMSMTEVVTKEGDVTEEDEITFTKLRTLRLSRLSILSCFCSENCTFELPSLEELALDSCRKMKCFSSGDVTAPILQRVGGDWGDEKVYKVKGDLNKTIQQIHDDTCDWEEDDSYEEEDDSYDDSYEEEDGSYDSEDEG